MNRGRSRAPRAIACSSIRTALFRARQQGSLNGDASEAARVRELAGNLADRYLRALREEAVP